MVFSQLAFLYFFIPLFFLLYLAAGRIKCEFALDIGSRRIEVTEASRGINARNLLIFVSGCIFYAWGEPFYVILMLISTAIDYTAGRFMDKYDDRQDIRRLCLIVSVCMNLGLLGLFKYSDFLIDSINSAAGTQLGNPVLSVNKALNSVFPLHLDEKRVHLPIGISFYTFQSMSYTIDLYMRKIKVQKSLLKFAAYVTLFPQIVAGPIVRYEHVEKELCDRTVTPGKVYEGIGIFVKGLSKKVLLANNIGSLWSTVKGEDFSSLPALTAWLGIIAFTLQIYFDFSGYSDMAVGLGKMMGFEFPKNFDHPYMSRSVSEFWRRWHMTLGEWFKSYVYIPLGGNRRGQGRTLINLMIVWGLTGLWHGASWNFVLWGIYFGVLIILERVFLSKLLEKLPSGVRTAYSLAAVIIGWVFFETDSLHDAFAYFGALFGTPLADEHFLYLLKNYALVLIVCIAASTDIVSRLKAFMPKTRLYRKLKTMVKSAVAGDTLKTVFVTLAEMAALFLCTCNIATSSYNPFLYFRF
ncbi:MAG: MBOAT family protein [Oscillospiraceae bacterium]|nr:MBOAT family protein [Oscillospiraceae bacterium]